MQNIRYCQIQGHEGNSAMHICTYKDCKLDNKWVCADCFIQSIHQHGLSDQTHLMKQQQFLDFIIKQSSIIYNINKKHKDITQTCILEVQKFIKSSEILINNLKEDLITINKQYNTHEIEEIIYITTNDYIQLENKQISKIININNMADVDFNLSLEYLKQWVKKFEDIQQLFKQRHQFDIPKESNFNLDNQKNLEPFNYRSHYYYESDQIIQTSQISQNEKYLAIGRYDQKIIVFNLISKIIIGYAEIENAVEICEFTNDSSILFCGDSKGYLHCYNIKNNFEKILKTKIHLYWISDIKILSDDQILTCSLDKTIKITNFKNNRQKLLIQNAHNKDIYAIEYDKIYEVIISCSADKSIKLFNINGQLLFQEQNAHNNEIYQIQLSNNKILSSSIEDLILWNLDYNQQKLTKINQFTQMNYNFSSIFDNRIVIVICENFIQILDINLIPRQQINHKVENFFQYFKTRQLNSMNYIIVPGRKDLEILQRI